MELDLSSIKIMLDFDNTIALDDYPNIGEAVPHALRVLRLLHDKHYPFILNTMRGTNTMIPLFKAYEYLQKNEIVIIDKTPKKILPVHMFVGNNIFIDDLAIDIPLLRNFHPYSKLYPHVVDWLLLEKIFKEKQII